MSIVMCNMVFIQCLAYTKHLFKMHLKHWNAAMKNEGEFKKAANSKCCLMHAGFRRQTDKIGKMKTKLRPSNNKGIVRTIILFVPI